jgi:aryl-alcohol dehydrogenase-like predicted oxidoreductase
MKAMQYFTFHGDTLSRVALGCDHFGETIDASVSWQNLDRFVQAGGTIIDVAHRYGQTGNDTPSKSERTIGGWMKDRGCREKIFLVTKGGHPDFDDPHLSRLDKGAVGRDIQGSLDDLQVDRVDLWYFHRDDESIPADELVDLANELVLDKGYSRYLGASNWKASRIEQANTWAKAHGRQPFAMSEIQASLAHCTPGQWGDDTLVCMNDREMDWYSRHDLPVMCFSPQAKGLFSKKISGGQLSQKAAMRFDTPQNRALIPLVKQLAEKLDVPPAAIVTSYLLGFAHPTLIPIIGASKTSQLEDTLSHIDLRLDQEDLQLLADARAKSQHLRQ